MRVLGLGQTSMDKNKEVKVVNVKQFSEEEILLAFQNKCHHIGIHFLGWKDKILIFQPRWLE